MKRKRTKKIKIMVLVSFSFFILFFSFFYALLSSDLNVDSLATISFSGLKGGDYIIDSVGEGVGGLQDSGSGDGSLVFNGTTSDAVTNFIQIPNDGVLWRIVSIDADKNLKIVRDFDSSLSSVYGNSDWASSTILQSLNNFYQQNLSGISDLIVQNPTWELTSSSNSNATKTTNIGFYSSSPIGLLRNDEIAASGDVANSGKTTSWVNEGNCWTMTIINSSKGWMVQGGKFSNSKLTSSANYRPVIYLKSSVLFSSGDGTVGSPFVVKY